MKQDNTKWVDEVLESTAGMSSARPRADLYQQIQARLGKKLPVKRISLGVMTAAAAGLLALLAINIKAIVNYSTETVEVSQEGDASVADIVDYYELGSNNIGL